MSWKYFFTLHAKHILTSFGDIFTANVDKDDMGCTACMDERSFHYLLSYSALYSYAGGLGVMTCHPFWKQKVLKTIKKRASNW